MNALVVDDNQLNGRLVSVFLKRLGWEVQCVASGDAALQSLKGTRFDMVLLDLRMPVMTGEQACRTLRADPAHAGLYVVAFTAHGMAEERDRMRAAGFDELLIKPISFADVKSVCDHFFARAA
ncbi:response regulator [Piscinibacter terrae]|uniref:Response regulator n=1 Tax=Piscinibacter terrae TaxID=2496871 RepID=A0A3N7HLK4_9BURK|nr:response regulator [Albitalea terrae]RQP21916.1 response regulator [Albitalea terrae]